MIPLNFRVIWGGLDLTEYPFGVEWGLDVGSPQSVSEALALLLTDGEVEVWTRDSNRSMTWTVLVEAPDMLEHAELGALLDNEASKARSELTLIPGDGLGAASVYDTYRADVVWLRDDDLEIAGFRRYQISLSAHPYPRSSVQSVVEAVAAGVTPTTVVVDDCSVATGWTGPSILATGGYVEATASVPGGSPPDGTVVATRLTRTGTFATSATNFLQVDWLFQGAALSMQAKADGVVLPPLAQATLSNGYTRSFFQVDAASVAEVEFVAFWVRRGLAAASQWFRIDQVVRTNVGPFVGTGRQRFRSLEVGGSARTQGSLQIAHDTSALGDVLVYTNVNDGSGYQPACRPFRISGNVTPTIDSSTCSGASEALNGGATVKYDIPARALPPGTYAIVARMMAGSTGFPGINWAASTRVGTTNLLTETGGQLVGLFAGVWTLRSLASVTLPPAALPVGSAGYVRVEVSCTSDVAIDELYLFNLDIGALSWVSCGTATPSAGGSSNRLWLDTATLDRPRPSVWLGTQADRSDARHAIGDSEVLSLGTHTLPPGDINLFTVTTNGLNAAASLTFFKRWRNNAAA